MVPAYSQAPLGLQDDLKTFNVSYFLEPMWAMVTRHVQAPYRFVSQVLPSWLGLHIAPNSISASCFALGAMLRASTFAHEISG